MKYVVTAIAFLTLNMPLQAAPLWCYGTINQFLTYSDGTVAVFPTWRNDWIHVCNLNATLNEVTPVTCAAWYSIIRTAATRQPLQTTVMFFQDGASCASLPTYSGSRAPNYIMLTP